MQEKLFHYKPQEGVAVPYYMDGCPTSGVCHMREPGAQTLMPTMALAARFFWNPEASASWPTLYSPAALAR